MNRKKQPMTNRLNKRVQKEVKKGLRASAEKVRSPSKTPVTPQALLKPYPKKAVTEDKRQLTSMLTVMERKKAQKHKKNSKRSSPKDSIVNSSPAHIHSEGTRWMKTVKKQSLIKNKRLTKKLSKRKN